mmetsp:Transcript_22543/g.40611  ORF Transcript_22543/g.40611 Transcript_22543/m.40611 type:complete len:191 (+) Transcript_22543:51-623(+)
MWRVCLTVLVAAEVDLLTDLQQTSVAEITELTSKLEALELRYRTFSTTLTDLVLDAQKLTLEIESYQDAIDATETESFEYDPAEGVLKRLKKLAGDIAVFETNVIYHHDDEMYDQTDAAVNALADSKERLQQLMQTVQNEIGELETLVKGEDVFYWPYMLTALLGLAVFCNCCAIVPAVMKPDEEEENEP